MGNRRTVIAGILLLALTFTNPAAAGELSSAGSTDRLLSSVAVLEEPSALEKIFRNSTGFWHLSSPGKIIPGAAIWNSVSGQACSAGWIFQRGEELLLSTAGHCGEVGDVFTVGSPDGSRTPIGKIVLSDYDSPIDLGVNDFALISIDEPSLIGSFVPLNDAFLPTDLSYSMPRTARVPDLTNITICGLGFRSGISCGPFEEWGRQGEIYFRRISDHGDSGGPIFGIKDNNIYPLGLGSAGNDYDATHSLAQPILDKMEEYDLQIVLSIDEVE